MVRSVSGLEARVIGARIRGGEGPAGWASRERTTVLVRDTRADPRRPVLPWQGGAEGTILAVPMLHQESCTGVLAFFRPAVDAFPGDEVRLLEAVAAQAAVATENARLHQKMVRLSQTDAACSRASSWRRSAASGSSTPWRSRSSTSTGSRR